MPGAMLQMEWAVKTLQEFTLTGNGPQGAGGHGSWSPVQTSMEAMVDHDWLLMWSATSPATQTTLLQAYSQAWFAQASQYTPQQYYQVAGQMLALTRPRSNSKRRSGTDLVFAPEASLLRRGPNLTDQMAAWAATIWPLGKWSVNDARLAARLRLAPLVTELFKRRSNGLVAPAKG